MGLFLWGILWNLDYIVGYFNIVDYNRLMELGTIIPLEAEGLRYIQKLTFHLILLCY